MLETAPSKHTEEEYPSQMVMKIPDKPEVVDVKDQFITRHEDVGLGREAILRSLYSAEAVVAQDAKRRSLRNVISDKKQNRALKREILKIRKTMNALSPEYAREIFDQMEDTFVKRALFHHGQIPENGDSFGERFMENDGKKHIVDDATVLNFSQWYMGRTLEKQQQLDAEIGELREQYKDRIRSAIKNGWLPDRVIDSFRNVDVVDVLQDDLFSTNINDDTYGYYTTTGEIDVTPTIIVSPRDNEKSSMEETKTHEWTHALANDPEADYHRLYFFTEVFGDEGGRLINEALTEHLAQSLVHGDFDTIDPHKRKTMGAYSNFRSFLDKLLNGGQIKIDIREFYDTMYFSQQDDLHQFTKREAVKELLIKIEKSFPGVHVPERLYKMENEADFEHIKYEMHNVSALQSKKLAA